MSKPKSGGSTANIAITIPGAMQKLTMEQTATLKMVSIQMHVLPPTKETLKSHKTTQKSRITAV